MAVSSLLSPEKIAKSPRGTVQSAQNFISGGSPIGGSVVESAANKIVGFERAQVRPISPDINSIISSITNNVLSSVDNTIKSATQIINNNVDNKITNVTEKLTTEIQNVRSSGPVTQLQNIVQVVQNKINQSIQKVISDFSNDYANKIRNIEENKPSQVLDKFLKVYRNALEFIQFFGNQKNIDRLRTNLVALKTSFNESFEVAKLVRQVIVKIVKQLSNLPRATPSGGGLNLDVKVPGSPLKKAGAPAMKGMGRGKMLGLGALGLGAAGIGGSMAVNALADSGEVQPQQVQTDIPQNLVDRFGAVVDRFSNILDSLIGKKKEENVTVSSSGSSGSSAPKTKPVSSGGQISSGPGVEGLADFIAGAESGGRFDAYAGDMGKGDPNITKMTLSELQKKYGSFSTAVGAYQFMPGTAIGLAKQMGLDPSKTVFTPEVQKKLNIYHLNQMGYADFVSGKISEKEFGTRIAQQYRALPVPGTGATYQDKYSRNNKALRTDQQFSEALKRSKLSTSDVSKIDVKLEPQKGKDIQEKQQIMAASTQTQVPKVSAAPTQVETTQQRAASVSQPPPTQVASSVNVLPIDLSSTQQQSGGGGGQVISSPPSQKNGPSVPLLPSSNPDNFLVLYSKIVYNVVDG